MGLCYLTNSGGDYIVPTSDSVGILRDFGLLGFFFNTVVKNNLQGHQSNKTAKGGG